MCACDIDVTAGLAVSSVDGRLPASTGEVANPTVTSVGLHAQACMHKHACMHACTHAHAHSTG